MDNLEHFLQLFLKRPYILCSSTLCLMGYCQLKYLKNELNYSLLIPKLILAKKEPNNHVLCFTNIINKFLILKMN